MFVEDTVKIALVLDSHHSKFLVLQWEQAMAVILPDTYGWPYIYMHVYTVYLVISKPKIPHVHRI